MDSIIIIMSWSPLTLKLTSHHLLSTSEAVFITSVTMILTIWMIISLSVSFITFFNLGFRCCLSGWYLLPTFWMMDFAWLALVHGPFIEFMSSWSRKSIFKELLNLFLIDLTVLALNSCQAFVTGTVIANFMFLSVKEKTLLFENNVHFLLETLGCKEAFYWIGFWKYPKLLQV